MIDQTRNIRQIVTIGEWERINQRNMGRDDQTYIGRHGWELRKYNGAGVGRVRTEGA